MFGMETAQLTLQLQIPGLPMIRFRMATRHQPSLWVKTCPVPGLKPFMHTMTKLAVSTNQIVSVTESGQHATRFRDTKYAHQIYNGACA